MLKILRNQLAEIVDNIDAGNTNITEDDCLTTIETLRKVMDKTRKLSKYQAYNYLNISRATFDNYVKEGKLPQGKKEAGFKEKFWELKDLDKFKNSK